MVREISPYLGVIAEFVDKPNLDSFRLEQEKIGTKRAQISDKLGPAHGKHKFEGTMPSGTGIT
jgi:hypothetical protein